MSDTDLELLARYTRDHAEDAFAEIVRRHLDLVHSAALRQVRSPQLAEEVAQSVFADLARSANRLAPGTVLTAWLYQVTRRTAVDTIRREARRQLREQIASEMNTMNATAADWTHIEPLLDEAMHALDETDRTAVLLRYFENKSLREVGQTLGTSDDAAQKRVSRAVERLREFFAKRGVAIGTSGLVVVISANAVQAAPVGLAVSITMACALSASTVATVATTTAAKAIAMTTLQKTMIGATLVAATGIGIYEFSQAFVARAQVETLQRQQTLLTEQFARERDEAIRQLAALRDDRERLSRDTAELLKLRGEVGLLRRKNAEIEKELLPNTRRNKDAERVDVGRPSFPRQSWGYAGNATPEAALQSAVWALSTGDSNAVQTLLPPEERGGFLNAWDDISLQASNMFNGIDGFIILKSALVSDQEVVLEYNLHGNNTNLIDSATVKRYGSEWMIVPTKGKPER